jgi:FkbM family methyltransferase
MSLKIKIKYYILNKLLSIFNKNNINVSFSQCGEDLLIQYIFRLRGIDKITYIDIGANNPIYLNNTLLFYLKGSKGINIEANPNLINLFLKHRVKDTNLNVGIYSKNEIKKFYIFNDLTLSTFSDEEAKKMENLYNHKIKQVIEIQTYTLNEIINKYNNGQFPDLLSIDIEGMEFEVLKTIDYNVSFPKVICIETAEYSPIGIGRKRNEIINFLKEKGYFLFADTNLNSIFVKNDFFDK